MGKGLDRRAHFCHRGGGNLRVHLGTRAASVAAFPLAWIRRLQIFAPTWIYPVDYETHNGATRSSSSPTTAHKGARLHAGRILQARRTLAHSHVARGDVLTGSRRSAPGANEADRRPRDAAAAAAAVDALGRRRHEVRY